MAKIYQIATKLPQGHKIFLITIKKPTFSILRPTKIYPNWYFWFENMYTIWQPWRWPRAELIHRTKASKIVIAFSSQFNFDNRIWTRVARFFLVHDTKTGKIVPTEHKMFPMFIKYPKCL
jgi:hypothetical protein